MSTQFLSHRSLAAALRLLAVGVVPFTVDAAAAAQHIACPVSIKGSTIQLSNPPPGWTPFVPDSLYLHSAAPIDGPPEQLGDLAEFSERKHGPESSYTYRLDSSFPAGKWIKCTYGVNGEVTLSKRIDDNTAQCTFVYRKGGKAGQNDIKISCE